MPLAREAIIIDDKVKPHHLNTSTAASKNLTTYELQSSAP